MSEKNVGKVFEKIFEETPKNRIMVATFSSNIHRIQQVINAAYMYGRKVAIIGRSMVNAVKTASELDYLWIPPRTLIDINETRNYRDEAMNRHPKSPHAPSYAVTHAHFPARNNAAI